MAARKTPRKTSFVPRVVFRVTITGAGVIPLCVTASLTSVEGCGGGLGVGVAAMCYADGGSCPSVAAACFGDGPERCPRGVADATFSDVKVDHDGAVPPDMRLGVADSTFKDVGSDADGGMDVRFGVADIAFKG